MLLGAHMSIAGGLEQALLRGEALGCSTVQLFTKSPNQWKERAPGLSEIDLFRAVRKKTGIGPLISHAGYLLNLASPDPVILEKSITAMICELQRCESLGIEYVVVHPGSYRTGTQEEGLHRIVESIDSIHSQTKRNRVEILLETTAGQGNSIGSRLEEMAQILDGISGTRRVGVCVDTCHVFAAGYDLGSADGCRHFFKSLDEVIGLDRLKVIHLNDSLRDCGSRVDRHAHIGHGNIGPAAFRWIMRCKALEKKAKVIETPKKGEMDRKNLDLLISYTGGRSWKHKSLLEL